MRKLGLAICLLVVWLMVLVQILWGQEEEVPAFDLGEVVVTATKAAKEVADVSAAVTVVTRDEIDESNALRVMDVLSWLPGVFVKKEAGFGRPDINIRGLGDRGRQIMVLIDGRPEKMGLFGCTITHSLPLDNVERIEVVRGGSSVLYGSDALGGVVNIITKEATEKLETDVYSSYGRYNAWDYVLRHGSRGQNLNYYLTVGNSTGDGHRFNADYDLKDYTAKFVYSGNNGDKTVFSVKYFDGCKHNPGSISNPTPEAVDDYKRGAIDLTFSRSGSPSSLRLYRNFGHHKLADGFHSKDFVWGVMYQYNAKLGNGGEFIGGIDLRKLGGRRLSAPAGQWAKSEYAPYVHYEHTSQKGLISTLGLRLNVDSLYGTEWCPAGGLVYPLVENTLLRANINKAFRSPQINELYMFPPSNTELEPEEVWNYEIGINRQLTNKVWLDMAVYRRKGNNLIVSRMNPSPPPMYKFYNTGEFDFKGMELGLDLRLGKGLSGLMYYSYLDSGDKTGGRPRHKFDLLLRGKHKKLLAFYSGQWVTGLYDKDDYKDGLDNYFVANMKLIYKATAQLEYSLAIDNVFNQGYELEKGYPMPSRTFVLGVRQKF